MTPLELFEAHCGLVDEISESLCWHYQISGALAFQEEACQEARKALWRCCQRFDPDKQVMQRRKSADRDFLAVLFQLPVERSDPYGNFWIASVKRIRGSVIDFFRSQRLITKLAVGQKPTPLYQDKFLSLHRPLRTGGQDTFADHLQAKDVTSERDEREHLQSVVLRLKLQAGLTPLEREIVDACFSNADESKKEVAIRLNLPFPKLQTTLASALTKMRTTGLPN